MAQSIGPNYAYSGQETVLAATIGSITNATATDVSLTVPDWIDTSFVPYVTVGSLDAGLVTGPAWVSAAGTVKIRIGNITGSPITPAASLTFNVVIL